MARKRSGGIPFVVRPDDMTGKHRERIPLGRPVLAGGGKVVPKRECPALKPSAGTGLEGLRWQQTGVGGFSLADCTRIPKQGEDFSFQADVGVNPRLLHRSPLARSLRDC